MARRATGRGFLMKLRVPAYVPLGSAQLGPPDRAEDATPVDLELNLSAEELEAYLRWLRDPEPPPLTSELEWTAWDIRTGVWWALGRPTIDPLDVGFIGCEIEVLEEQ